MNDIKFSLFLIALIGVVLLLLILTLLLIFVSILIKLLLFILTIPGFFVISVNLYITIIFDISLGSCNRHCYLSLLFLIVQANLD